MGCSRTLTLPSLIQTEKKEEITICSSFGIGGVHFFYGYVGVLLYPNNSVTQIHCNHKLLKLRISRLVC